MTASAPLSDDELLRYNRQIMLPGIGIEGQERLRAARVVIIGLGGLGSPVAMYLAASGIGELVLVDPDRVELPNLQRQIVHTSADLGRLKVESAAETLRALNPDVSVITHDHRFDHRARAALSAGADVVIDGTDNFAARFAINRGCWEARTPLVSGAVIRMEGQVAVFRLDDDAAACYHCLYGEVDEPPETCAENGVLGSVAGLVGCIQATEAVKLILGLGETLAGSLLLVDAAGMDFRRLRLSKDPHCPLCSGARS